LRVNEAISLADGLRPNALGEEIKARWLRELDMRIAEMLRLDAPAEDDGGAEKGGAGGHGGTGVKLREGVDIDTDTPETPEWPRAMVWPEEDPELLLPDGNGLVYVYYLAAQTDYFNEEAELYAGDSARYNAAMAEAGAQWRREHAPRKRKGWRGM